MAPLGLCWPDEVDVFSVPHSRMKTLVDTYKNLITSTDFSDGQNLQVLLRNLQNVFSEFKAHEHIENSLIMKRLKIKLRAASVTNAAVCNCHNDNRLSEMLHLVLDGYKLTQKTKTERQNYGDRLKKALEDFTKKFIPHMEEEEMVFQPMLMQYFSYDELKELKAKVIEQHDMSKSQEESIQEKYVDDSKESDGEQNRVEKEDHFSKLPNEICQQIFALLSPKDLVKISQVSKRWQHLSKDPALWCRLYPVHWAQGNWSFYPEPQGGVDGPGVDVKVLKRFSELGSYSCLDEDADFDDSEDSDGAEVDDPESHKQILSEAKMLTAIVKYLLPVVGEGVKVFDLAYSRGLSNSLVHKILKLCPNLEVFDLTHTKVGDDAFKEFGANNKSFKLRYLDLTGCDNITDLTLFSLANKVLSEDTNHQVEIENLPYNCPLRQSLCCKKYPSAVKETISYSNHTECTNTENVKSNICEENFVSETCDLSYVYLDMLIESDGNLLPPSSTTYQDNVSRLSQEFCCLNCVGTVDQTGLSLSPKICGTGCKCPGQTVSVTNVCDTQQSLFDKNSSHAMKGLCSLEFLSLNGCYRISDSGLCALAIGQGTPNLTHLDVSGCIAISGYGLSKLVSTCLRLDHAHLFYCDNIKDDPYRSAASGCRNVECGSRFCCSMG
ncbi:F-box/LRR-repeat protein 5 [Biomphalaria pfeifferi]|uniref:F-box/LRR-repeat protein 5 n=1 Tax=Biomphalaria pfeifferi TaxID=112525 RepID=A0AAD8BZ86_BIOPF|nr:F-box/LRR-repeat protein 5 [Biomphalaria pfeifferi]